MPPAMSVGLNTWTLAADTAFWRLRSFCGRRRSWQSWVTRVSFGGELPSLTSNWALFFQICQDRNKPCHNLLPAQTEPLRGPWRPCHSGLLPLKLFPFDFFLMIYFILDVCVYLSICITMYMQVPVGVRREHWIPWNWNCRQLWTSLWVLRMEPTSFAKAASALSCWAISLAPSVRCSANDEESKYVWWCLFGCCSVCSSDRWGNVEIRGVQSKNQGRGGYC